MTSTVGYPHWARRADIVATAETAYQRHHLGDAQSLPALIERIGHLHGKPIGLTAISDSAWGALTALWVDYPDQAQIFYRSTDSPLYQAHCILHELAHIALQHPGCNVLPQQADLTEYAADGGVVRGRLLTTDTTTMPETATSTREVLEGEAEHLAHRLSTALLRPAHTADEALFG